jgi:hypothetical protein
MDASRLLPVALLAALAFVPAAQAHTVVGSTDGKVRAVIGQLNEPVSTYAVSGLDICFSDNTTAAHAPLSGINAGGLSATLVAPDGNTLHQDLKGQFGRPGCFTFAKPYVLTQPGQYVVELSGSVNGSTVDLHKINAGGAVEDRADITFPDTQVPNNLDLEARVTALEAKADSSATPTHKSPSPVAAFTIIGLALLAAARRVR